MWNTYVTHSRMSKSEAWGKAIYYVEQDAASGRGDNIMKSYPHHSSGRMRQRVGIAMGDDV